MGRTREVVGFFFLFAADLSQPASFMFPPSVSVIIIPLS